MTSDELRALYPGTTTYRDVAAALKLVGADGPYPEAFAHRYESREAAEAYAASNLEHHGHPSLGIAELPGGGWVGVIDLAPSIERMRAESRASCKEPDCDGRCDHFDRTGAPE